MSNLLRTQFHHLHCELGAQMVDFGGWEMPIQYASGILTEHLQTRQNSGLFDVSHMGRFQIEGDDALPFLQYVLTNNAAALEVGESQYTLIQNENGGALDDAYLYRFFTDSYLLVVNASNRIKDWEHFQQHAKKFDNLRLTDITFNLAMLALQGPQSKKILESLVSLGNIPAPMRNSLSVGSIGDSQILMARTGYTGEPICFELFFKAEGAETIWKRLLAEGAVPIGLGARDTLRLEASLPLYGHELGADKDGNEIPLLASRLSRFGTSFSPLKGDFLGKAALADQHACLQRIIHHDFSELTPLPKMIFSLAITGKGVAREGYEVFRSDKKVGYITSGTMVPYHLTTGEGMNSLFSGASQKRSICLAYLDSTSQPGDILEVQVRKKRISCMVVPYHVSSEAPPYVRAIPHDSIKLPSSPSPSKTPSKKVASLIKKSIDNSRWRQQECINLIPSEQTQSSMTRLLSITDACGRYAEHKEVKAFSHADVFYYQGVDFISEVEKLLGEELQKYFGCASIESRLISGQMANTAVFSAMVDYINRGDRKSEPARMKKVLNNHIIRGGHLSAQPMGALRDFIARDPQTEKPAVINFPVLAENPFKIDTKACQPIIEEHKPDLIILGKSMTLHKEPVREMRAYIDQHSPDTILMYDMAHVLGLCGNHFQDPFGEGADLVTGSTHKTFFGTQRGVIASNVLEEDRKYPLWEAIQRRAFPGSVSNHHLGTLVGLLMATYEMIHFKDTYQQNVIRNAKTFAKSLNECGLDVAGDPSLSFTETHQVIINVGYSKGYEVAQRLEANNIIVNYQATPAEEGFTAAGALRTGVSEMTRFGMQPEDFQELAQMFHDVIVNNMNIKDKVTAFRQNFNTMYYCFEDENYSELMEQLHKLL